MKTFRSGEGKWIWALLSVPLLVVLIVPVAALIARAVPQEIGRELRSDEAWSAIGVSLRTTALSLAALLVLGTPLAYALAGRPFRGRRMIDALLGLPAVLPPAVAGIALLLAFGRSGVFGPWLADRGIQLPFTAGAVVLAQLFVSAPFYVRPAISAFRGVDSTLVEAAALDGAGAFAVFSRLFLPLSRAALLGAASVAWARALGEFGATILFAGSRLGVTRTMPLAVYLGYDSDISQSIALSVILLAVAVVVLSVGLWIGRHATDLIFASLRLCVTLRIFTQRRETQRSVQPFVCFIRTSMALSSWGSLPAKYSSGVIWTS